MELLNISDIIFKKYKRTVKGNEDLDVITVRKKLTRNFMSVAWQEHPSL